MERGRKIDRETRERQEDRGRDRESGTGVAQPQ